MKDTDTGKDLAKALKGVMNHAAWPVSFVLSGLPEIDQIAKLDEQFERRGMFIRLPDVRLPRERRLIEKIIRELSKAGNIDCQVILASDIPERIAHAANYRYGRIAQVTTAALETSFEEGHAKLTRENFVKAFNCHSHAMEHPEMNPFLAEDWQRLPSGSFILDNEDR